MADDAKGAVVWITGRPQSGKSTFALSLAAALRGEGRAACVLDGDVVRHVLVPEPGYDEAGRDAFYATLAGLAGALAAQPLVVVVAATAHLRKFRVRARELVHAPFFEVFVSASEAECRARDSKGLYAAADAGEMPSLPSAALAYEPPEAADFVATGGHDEAAVREVTGRVTRIARDERGVGT